MLNTHHALSARAHWLFPAGPSWFTLGAGPVLHPQTTTTRDLGGSRTHLSFKGGAAVAAGVETQVNGRLFRFELGAHSRGRRVDLLGLAAMGF